MGKQPAQAPDRDRKPRTAGSATGDTGPDAVRKQGSLVTFFISYTQRDRNWAEWVAWVILEAGHKVKIQAWDFVPGSSWPQEMHEALQDAAALVCILSPDFLKSDFAAAEWQAAFAKDPVGKKRSIIPVRVRNCEPDGLLSGRVYVDLVGKPRDVARDLIRHAVSRRRSRPDREPPFPGENEEPSYPGIAQYTVVFDGEFSETNKARVQAVLEHLRRLLEDANMTISRMDPGSLVVVFEADDNTIKKLERLIEGGERQFGGMQVLAAWRRRETTGSPVGERLNLFREWTLRALKGVLPDDDAEDIAQDLMLELYELDQADRYSILGSPGKAASIAQALLKSFCEERAHDQAVRRRIRDTKGGVARRHILESASQAYDLLAPDDKQTLETYWTSVFDESPVTETLIERVEEITEAMENEIVLVS